MAKTLVVLAVTYGIIFGSQLYMYVNKIYDPLWVKYFKNVSSNDRKFIIYGAVAFAIVCAAAVLHSRWKSKGFLTAALIIFVTMTTIEMRPVGAHMWTYEGKILQGRIPPDMMEIYKVPFMFPRTDDARLLSLGPRFNVGVVETWYFERYIQFLKQSANELDARKILLGQIDGRRLFFSESIEYPTVTAFLRNALRYRENTPKVLSYTGDELIVEINVPSDGYLNFIDNWDYGWKVFVDEKEAKMELLFGTFKAVKLTLGMHHVRFSYEPGWFFRFKK